MLAKNQPRRSGFSLRTGHRHLVRVLNIKQLRKYQQGANTSRVFTLLLSADYKFVIVVKKNTEETRSLSEMCLPTFYIKYSKTFLCTLSTD